MRRFILPAALLLSLAAARAADTQPAPASQPADFSLTLHVQSQVADDGHLAIAGATITRIGTAGDNTPLAVTAPNGTARITLPSSAARNFALLASRDGYVAAYKEWSRKNAADLPPTDLTFSLEPATPLGGKVLDTDGQPFQNATIVIKASKKYPALDQTGYTHIRAITKANGNFATRELPETFDNASVGFYSLDALSDYWYPTTDMHSLDEIRHWAAALRIPRGSPITLTVAGPDHQPPRNATLDIGKDWDVGNRIPPVPFPDDGQLTLGLTKNTSLLATAKAPGMAPQQLTLTANSDKPFAFSLHKATPLNVTIVDKSGKPIPAARVYVRKWGDVGMFLDLHATNGKASWTEAPDPGPPILADIDAPGFVTLDDAPLTPGIDNTITLTNRPTIKGAVTDAATHQPLTTFHIEEGLVFKDGAEPVWQPSDGFDKNTKRTSPGHFEFKPAAAYAGLALRVTAPDHLPADIKPFKVDGTDHEFTFDLQPGKGVSGTLVDAAGKPLPKMTIYRITSLPDTENNRLRDFEAGYLPHTTSADDGSFSFPPQAEPYALLVLNDTGIAKAGRNSIKPGQPLTLTFEAFGTLEGDVRFSTKPAPEGTLVTLRDPQPTRQPDEILFSALNRLSTRTDKTGHFTLPRIPPGEHTIARIIPEPNGQQLSADPTPFQIVSGKTSNVRIGGEGRPVTGKIDLAPLKGAAFHTNANLTSNTGQAPEILAKSFPLLLAPDGSFRIENVPPGSYTLHITFFPPPNPNARFNPVTASVSAPITLPDSPTTDTPFDTGAHPLTPTAPSP